MIEFNGTFLVAMLSFVVFILIMNAIFYNPIYEDAKRLKNEAEEFNTTRSAKLEQTQDKCRHELKNAIDKAQSNSVDKIKAAKENTKQIIQAKKEQLLLEETELKNNIKNMCTIV